LSQTRRSVDLRVLIEATRQNKRVAALTKLVFAADVKRDVGLK
jgi:hypothetical protein